METTSKPKIPWDSIHKIVWAVTDELPDSSFKRGLQVKLILALSELEKELETNGVEIT